MKGRENNYDLLRIIASVAVVMIHVSGTYFEEYISGGGGQYYSIRSVCINNAVSRFAVPCFIMLSGAFILTDDKNSSYLFFYKKIFWKVGIHTFFFSLLYFIYSMIRQIVMIMFIQGEASLIKPVTNLLAGHPFYHMWYLYMMIFIYLLVPIIIRIKQDVGEKVFERIMQIFFFFAVLSGWTSTHLFSWDIGYSFCYLAFFCLGYLIRRKESKSNVKAVIYIGISFIIGGIISLLRYKQAINGIPDNELNFGLVDAFNPLVVIMSISVFCGFSKLNVKKDLKKFSSNTFFVYLLHAGIWDIVSKAIKIFLPHKSINIIIPFAIILVWTISFLFANVYRYLWNFIYVKIQPNTLEKENIKEKLIHY